MIGLIVEFISDLGKEMEIGEFDGFETLCLKRSCY